MQFSNMAFLWFSTVNYFILECSITKRPVQDLPALYKGLTIFVDFPFQCDGQISSVEFYARHSGNFYLSAWRPSPNNDQWELHGFVNITSEQEGLQVCMLHYHKNLHCHATSLNRQSDFDFRLHKLSVIFNSSNYLFCD